MWHVDDVVAYDLMRALADRVQARHLALARSGHPTALAQVRDLRRAILSVDGFDRQAVDAFSTQLQSQERALTLSPSDGG